MRVTIAIEPSAPLNFRSANPLDFDGLRWLTISRLPDKIIHHGDTEDTEKNSNMDRQDEQD